MPVPSRYPRFRIKVAVAFGLVVLAEGLVYDHIPGAGLGIVALALVMAVLVANPALWRRPLPRSALVVALAFGASQIERASLLGALAFAAALAVAALSARARPGDDVWGWSQRLVAGGLKAAWGPLGDLRRLARARARTRRFRFATLLAASAMPVLGGLLFLFLFSLANPVIEQALGGLRLPAPDAGRIVFGGLTGLAVWAVLRPRGQRRTLATPGLRGDLGLPGATTASVIVSLVVFNAIFALQNGLDIAFLWSGAPLPGHLTLAAYAHRGAYPLIATALLAGLFVLVFLRPGSSIGQARAPRALVTVWVAQNLLLVASTIWRTLDYLQAYSLTRLRIAALAWMGLVAVGLALICWRLLRAKSAGWLINANALAAGAVLAACSVTDLGAVAAAWNVSHARELTGSGAALDLCYLRTLNGAAVVSLADLERRPLPADLRERVGWTRRVMVAELQARQADWPAWRWRDARRLARVRALVGAEPGPPVHRRDRRCDGARPSPPPGPMQLTPAAQPGT